ncbi:MAG: WbqC family protein, partial [Candidatus Hydrogenedentes bacterium]|nr:WbqC family protein [Candidatus Hydrogenedentota bacterium]
DVYAREWEGLNELNRHMLEYYVLSLGIRTPIVYSSELNVAGEATTRLVNLLRAVGADRYYSGAYALDQYLDADLLDEAGITLEIQQWSAPVYPQRHGDFIPDLAIVDLLMNCGPASLDILLGNVPAGNDGSAAR